MIKRQRQSIAAELIARIQAMVDAGMTRPQIAPLVGLSEWRLKVICLAHCITAPAGRRPGDGPGARLPEWSELEIELKTASQAVVAERHGVSSSAISQARRLARKKAERAKDAAEA